MTSAHRPWFDGATAFRCAAGSLIAAPFVLLFVFSVALSAAFCVDGDSDGCISSGTAVAVFVVGSVLVCVPFVAGVARLTIDVARRPRAVDDVVCHDRRLNRKAIVAVVSTAVMGVAAVMPWSASGRGLALVLLVVPLGLFAIVHGLRAITEVREAGRDARGGTAARWSIAVTVMTMLVVLLLPV